MGNRVIPSPNRPFSRERPVVYSPEHAEKGLSMAQTVARTRFLTVAEVAQNLRVSTMTVYRLVKAGHLAATRIGKSYRISESDLDQYLASRYTQAG